MLHSPTTLCSHQADILVTNIPAICSSDLDKTHLCFEVELIFLYLVAQALLCNTTTRPPRLQCLCAHTPEQGLLVAISCKQLQQD